VGIRNDPMPSVWQKTASEGKNSVVPALDTHGADAQLVYGRAVLLGRFRFGWSERQYAFLRTETEQWTADTCLALGESIVGNRDSCLWELAPLEQAALCRFRFEQIDDLIREVGLSSALHQSFAFMRAREAAQRQEYEQLAQAVQHVSQASEREINNPWFLDVLQTLAINRIPVKTLRAGLRMLAHILADIPFDDPEDRSRTSVSKVFLKGSIDSDSSADKT